jgi:hypothetical protein
MYKQEEFTVTHKMVIKAHGYINKHRVLMHKDFFHYTSVQKYEEMTYSEII